MILTIIIFWFIVFSAPIAKGGLKMQYPRHRDCYIGTFMCAFGFFAFVGAAVLLLPAIPITPGFNKPFVPLGGAILVIAGVLPPSCTPDGLTSGSMRADGNGSFGHRT